LDVNSFIGQPQKEFFATKIAFSACYVLMVAIPGAFDPAISGMDFLKEIPMTLFRPNGI
jgi:peroxiredoxin